MRNHKTFKVPSFPHLKAVGMPRQQRHGTIGEDRLPGVVEGRCLGSAVPDEVRDVATIAIVHPDLVATHP